MIQKAISVVGATAAGKSEAALRLAATDARFIIINADSQQVYEGMCIGTGAPCEDEKRRARHLLYNHRSPAASYDVGLYLREVEDALARLAADAVPIFVGGAGFYHRALWQGLPELPKDEAMRATLEREWHERGPDYLYRELLEKDRAASERIHPRNKVRLLRALEVIRLTGGLFSGCERKRRPIPCLERTVWLKWGVDVERAALYERINRRVDAMLEAGLVDELKGLFERIGAVGALVRTVGYKELLPYLAGESDLDTCVRAIKLSTRHYAKRQLTWFRHEPDILWGDEEKLLKLGRALIE